MAQKKGKRIGAGGSALLADERRHILSPDSNFFIREAYKTLRTNTMFALAGQEGCKTVVVTSSLQSEGKSITALNLAISFAEAENRVLLIDCDTCAARSSRVCSAKAPARDRAIYCSTPRCSSKPFFPAALSGSTSSSPAISRPTPPSCSARRA